MDDNTGVYQIWTAPVNIDEIGISQISSVIPEGYSLGQNYPNPFNPNTVINYQIPKAGSVKLKVYDALGNEVATLVDRNQNAGTYEVTFSAKDAGTALSSGVYFYRLETDDFTENKRMVLIK
ncbi:MAG: T9SS type A sorting domain-containing protein [Ignavibacteriae bacterium]|nr:T9SS type A sorting domain-containing protein [Ignavibacteriota bacterium]